MVLLERIELSTSPLPRECSGVTGSSVKCHAGYQLFVFLDNKYALGSLWGQGVP